MCLYTLYITRYTCNKIYTSGSLFHVLSIFLSDVSSEALRVIYSLSLFPPPTSCILITTLRLRNSDRSKVTQGISWLSGDLNLGLQVSSPTFQSLYHTAIPNIHLIHCICLDQRERDWVTLMGVDLFAFLESTCKKNGFFVVT